MGQIITKIFHSLFISSDSTPPHDKATHITFAIIISILLVLPIAFKTSSNKDSSLTFFGHKMPSVCLTKNITDADCPGCGLTRSFTNITEGNFQEAFNLNRISLFLYIYFILSLFYHLYCLTIMKKKIPMILYKTQRTLSNAMIVLLIANWITGLFLGSNGGLP